MVTSIESSTLFDNDFETKGNNMNKNQFVVDPQSEIGEMIYDGRYFGSHGALALSRKQYQDGKYQILRMLTSGTQGALGYMFAPVIMAHINTLNSSLKHCAAQAKRGRIQYLWNAIAVYIELFNRLQEVLRHEQWLTYGEKEVLIPTLLVFARKGKAMQFAGEIIKAWYARAPGREVAVGTFLLTTGRVYQMQGRRIFRELEDARTLLLDEKVQEELGLDNLVRIATLLGMPLLAKFLWREEFSKLREDTRLKYE